MQASKSRASFKPYSKDNLATLPKQRMDVMEQRIEDYRCDEEGHWVALLDCGHPQHLRHKAPFENRPWVLTAEGREANKGAILNCVRCDAFEHPEGLVRYKQTPIFTETTIPTGLQRTHRTKAGVWGKIVVEAGLLRYVVEMLGLDLQLTPDQPGTVVPTMPHYVEAVGPVRFHVEFYRRPRS